MLGHEFFMGFCPNQKSSAKKLNLLSIFKKAKKTETVLNTKSGLLVSVSCEPCEKISSPSHDYASSGYDPLGVTRKQKIQLYSHFSELIVSHKCGCYLSDFLGFWANVRNLVYFCEFCRQML